MIGEPSQFLICMRGSQCRNSRDTGPLHYLTALVAAVSLLAGPLWSSGGTFVPSSINSHLHSFSVCPIPFFVRDTGSLEVLSDPKAGNDLGFLGVNEHFSEHQQACPGDCHSMVFLRALLSFFFQQLWHLGLITAHLVCSSDHLA